jgi:ABC-type uncharacterized transport system fused permease/ATPase subunit
MKLTHTHMHTYELTLHLPCVDSSHLRSAFVTEAHAYAVGWLFNAAVTADVSAFVRLCGLNLVVDQLTAVVEEAVTYTGHVLGAAWHQRLALYCTSRLMTHGHFYALRHRDGRVTDADQRIAEEVKVAADAFAELFGRAIMPSIDLLWFSASLYRLMGARGVAYLAAYAAMSASMARVFQPDVEALGRKENELSSMYV